LRTSAGLCAVHACELLIVLRAVLTAPAWLSGRSDTAYGYVRSQLEKQAPAEVIAIRDQTQQMLAEVERGQRAVRARLIKRGGLDKPGTAPPRWPTKPKPVAAPKQTTVWSE
jgi:hypothetical protein